MKRDRVPFLICVIAVLAGIALFSHEEEQFPANGNVVIESTSTQSPGRFWIGEPDELRERALILCADVGVEQMARSLSTRPTEEAVARALAWEADELVPQSAAYLRGSLARRRAAIYDGCLEGFKGGSSSSGT